MSCEEIQWEFRWLPDEVHRVSCKDISKKSERVFSLLNYLGANLDKVKIKPDMKPGDIKITAPRDEKVCQLKGTQDNCIISFENLDDTLRYYLNEVEMPDYIREEMNINVNTARKQTPPRLLDNSGMKALKPYFDIISGRKSTMDGGKNVTKSCKYKKTSERHVGKDKRERVVYVKDGKRYVKRKSPTKNTFRFVQIKA